VNPEWDEAAYDALADIWVRISPDERDRVEAAVNRANRDLQTAPDIQGESRAGYARVLIINPITFWFRVRPNGIARIFHVHHIRPARRR
jgi:hypothetical protein